MKGIRKRIAKDAATARVPAHSEKHIQTQILTWLRKLPACKPIKITGGMFMEAGISDIIACVNGRYVAIEVKKPGGVVSALQTRFIESVERAGGIGFVAYSLDEVKERLKDIVK